MRRPQVLIFAKPPRIGLAKTRLAQSLGSSVTARRIATAIQAKTLRASLRGPWETILYTAPDRELDNSLGGLWPAHLERRSQGRGHLGDRRIRNASTRREPCRSAALGRAGASPSDPRDRSRSICPSGRHRGTPLGTHARTQDKLSNEAHPCKIKTRHTQTNH